MMSTPPQLKVGGRYALGAMIGHGAGSTVFRGEDEVLKRPVAIKIVASENAATYRAALAASARLGHPAYVGIFDSLEFDNQFVIIQEYIGGQSFAELARAHPGAFQTASVGQEIGLALVHAHRLGIAHGDLTPTAMFHDQWGAIRINNVGLPPDTAYFAAAGAILAGTPWTASVPSFRDDLRALGVALWLLLAGQALPPSTAGGATIGWDVVRPDVPGALRDVIERLIIPEHANAFASAEAAVGALRGCMRALQSQQTQVPPWESPRASLIGSLSQPLVTPTARPHPSVPLQPSYGHSRPINPADAAPAAVIAGPVPPHAGDDQVTWSASPPPPLPPRAPISRGLEPPAARETPFVPEPEASSRRPLDYALWGGIAIVLFLFWLVIGYLLPGIFGR